VAKLRNWKNNTLEELVVKLKENKLAETPVFRLNINIKLGIKA